jgi:hypothetical protein
MNKNQIFRTLLVRGMIKKKTIKERGLEEKLKY